MAYDDKSTILVVVVVGLRKDPFTELMTSATISMTTKVAVATITARTRGVVFESASGSVITICIFQRIGNRRTPQHFTARFAEKLDKRKLFDLELSSYRW